MKVTPPKGWKITPNEKLAIAITKRLVINDGECPCHNPGKTREDRLCPCVECRENGVCHCGLFVREGDTL